MSTQLAIIPDLENAKELALVTPERALSLKATFVPFFSDFIELEEEATNVAVNQPKAAREMRLKLRKVRTSAEKARKEAGEEAKKYKQAVDGLYNILEGRLSPIEKRMDDIERAEEIAEQERLNKLRAERVAAWAPYGEVPGYDLTSLPEAQFQTLLAAARKAHEDKLKAEQERVAAEKAREEERLRLKAENERLAKEAAEAKRISDEKLAQERAAAEMARHEQEDKVRKERAEQETRLRVEREAREKAEAAQRELQRKAVEEAEKKVREAARLAAAPDVEKLRVFANAIRGLAIPALAGAHLSLQTQLREQTDKFAAWVDKKADELV